MPISASILSVGDRYASHEVKDEAGDVLLGVCAKLGWNIRKREVLPHEEEGLVAWLTAEADSGIVDVILTVDGIGVAPQERVPEAMYRVCEKWLPGISEIIRINGYAKNPNLAMTRGVAGVRGKTILINLPGGSPTAIKDAMEVIKPVLRQAVEQVKGSGV